MDRYIDDNILVTIIVRTCNRPEVLQGALKSIRKQTYKNIQTVVIEDGEGTSESLLTEGFKDLTIKYYATKKKVGRCKAGNIGLEMADGQYVNFLDDDDILYENHVELLVDTIITQNSKIAYAIAEEVHIVKSKLRKSEFKEKKTFIRYQQPYNKMLLFFLNYMPIQSVMFSIELYNQLGGLDEKLSVWEDWDLWVRYSTVTDFIFVPVITSAYRVSNKKIIQWRRNKEFREAYDRVVEKYESYNINITVNRINKDIEYLVKVYKTNKVKIFLRKIKDKILY